MNTSLENKAFNLNAEKAFEAKGYKYFTNGDYNLNIFGIRSAGSVLQENYFDDIICVDYKINGLWNREIFTATVDPGLSSLNNPINVKGCAILVPNQYSGMFKIGMHKSSYKALVQNKAVDVYRDNNKDNILDFDPATIENGLFGINLHKAGEASTIVDGWSAGCQVLAKSKDFEKLMSIVDKSAAIYGDTFTYTLLNEADIDTYVD